MKLFVIIINYCTAKLTIECLHSLFHELASHKDRQAIVIDNLSEDGSAELIEEEIRQQGWADWAVCVRSSRNGGFSAGNNLGINNTKADFYLLLNSDTRVRPGAIDALLEAANIHPQAGLIGPRLESLDGTSQISTFRFHSPISELIRTAQTGPVTKLCRRWDVPIATHKITKSPDWISFAAVLIRRTVIEQIGLMDEGYFMYFEDADYCHRSKTAGWDILYWPEARFIHLRGGSSPVKTLTAKAKRLPHYFYASRSRYYAKFYGFSGFLMANVLWIFGRTISFARELIGNKKRSVCEREWTDIWTNGLSPMRANNKRINRETST
jgi:GT2 family glycosyltransferase